MAFSQVGEYVEDLDMVAPMMEIVVQHLKHPNPKVRFSACHCLGQMADDVPKKFQEKFGAAVLPAMLETVEDQVPRVSAHCCSAISNFSEGSTSEQLFPFLPKISEKLGVLMKNGISIQKEHSVTALATTIVQIKEKFDPFFAETIDLLLDCLNTHLEPAYK